MKSSILITHENYEGSISSILRTRNFEETIENVRKKLDTPVAPAMPCKNIKSNKNWVTHVNPMRSNQNLRAFWKQVNLQDCLWENHCRLIMKTMLQEKETIHYSIKIWFKFIPMPQAMKILRSKGSSGQGMGKIGENLGVEPDESQK